MTATRCPDDNELGLLADGRLGARARRALERHLDGCASCSRLIGELAQIADARPAVPERYALVRRLGAGGMGVVWEAEDRQLQRKVALKWMLPDPADDAAGDRTRRARLVREARALAQLRHPNVLTVHEVGEIGDEGFVVLELVDGATARAWRDAAPRTPEAILAVWRQAGAGLAAVHRAGIVHRDVKPDNVLVAGDGRVLLGDFGLATAHAAAAATALTAAGQVLGTPLYMAAEQLLGEPATARSDQFALCVCMWEALAGARPFAGATAAALAVAMLRAPAVPDHVDRRVFAALARGLAADPAARWPDVGALLDALAAPPRRRRRAVVGAGVLGTLALAAAAAAGAAWRARAPAPTLEVSPAVGAVVPAPPAPVADAGPVALDATAGPVQVALGSAAAPPAAAVRGALHDPPGAPARDVTGAPARDAIGGPAREPRRTYLEERRAETGWDETRVTDLLRVRDGRGCLAELDRVHPRGDPLEPLTPAYLAADYRGMCTMLAGDCAAGRATFERLDRARNPTHTAAQLASFVDREDARWCPLDAPPEERWPVRVAVQLDLAASAHTSCAPILAFVDAHHLVLPPASGFRRVQCLVDAGDCAGARAGWRGLMIDKLPRALSEDERTAEAEVRFSRTYPGCAM